MIYHLALPGDWAAAQRAGWYTVSTRDRSLDDVGFIHAAYEGQVDGVAKRFYADVDALVLLVIDPAAVGAPVVEESASGHEGAEHFPHIYGPLPIGAVAEVRPWR